MSSAPAGTIPHGPKASSRAAGTCDACRGGRGLPTLRQILIILASLGLVPAATSAAAERPHAGVPPGWKPDVQAAAAYASRRTGTVSFAVRTDDDLWGRRKKMDVNSASVIKAMLLV